MTDTKPYPWHTISVDEVAELRRQVADAELRAMKAVQAEDVAQFAFETAKRRADKAEQINHALLIEYVIEPRIPAGYPEPSADAAAEIADALLDQIDENPDLDDLDPSGLIQGWVEGLR